jgi:hypothetical protein
MAAALRLQDIRDRHFQLQLWWAQQSESVAVAFVSLLLRKLELELSEEERRTVVECH